MTVDEALRKLDELGSTDDPIWVGGEETTPADLATDLWPGTDDASEVRITYWGERGGTWRFRKKRGTLSGMVKDRLAFKKG